jgi:hypothetical protein
MHYEQRKDGELFSMMRRTNALAMIVLAAFCFLSWAAVAQQRPGKDQRLPAAKKVLIVYLSRTNNTKAIAEIIHQKIGGRLVALELERPYPADYRMTVEQVVHENETGYLPPLKRRSNELNSMIFCFSVFRPGECNCRRP